MDLKKSLFVTIVLSIITIGAWELYWRSQGYYPNLNDDKTLWAKERAKVENATKKDIILIGSSRTYFDLQKKEWEKETGVKPIQLASTGSSPLPALNDIIENTHFNGTIIIGVTPGLFFSTTNPDASPWQRIQSKIDFYRKITYAQKSNYALSIPLQKNLVLMSGDEEEWEDDIDLKSLLRRIHIGNRNNEEAPPPFYNFGDVASDRNIVMTQRTVLDTAHANSIKRVWNFFARTSPPPDKIATTKYFLKKAKKFISRGGNLILVRLPSSGGYRLGENKFLSREKFWNALLTQIDVKSYHFEDYEQLKNLSCPEESHLSKKDAQYLTTELAKIMINDNAITNLNIN
jgi:hypothetical protein